MTIQINQVEVISALVGVVIGYKLHAHIQGLISSVKKSIANIVQPKP